MINVFPTRRLRRWSAAPGLFGRVLAPLLILLPGAWSDAAAPVPSNSGDRFLFVVETSSAMSRLGHSSRQAVFDLIWSGLDGHMRPGDTYGVWTYNAEPQPGKFPMQVWGTNTVELASRAGIFLREQPLEKRTKFAPLMASLKTVIQVVKDVSIFVVTEGTVPVEDTPFDAEINATLKQRGGEARSARKPFVLTLIARGGALVHWSVTLPGESIKLLERVTVPPVVVRLSAPPRPLTNVARVSLEPIIMTRRPPSNEISISVAPAPTPPPPAPRTNDFPSPTPAHVEVTVAPTASSPSNENLMARLALRPEIPSTNPAVTLSNQDAPAMIARAVVVTDPPASPTNLAHSAPGFISPLVVSAREPARNPPLEPCPRTDARRRSTSEHCLGTMDHDGHRGELSPWCPWADDVFRRPPPGKLPAEFHFPIHRPPFRAPQRCAMIATKKGLIGPPAGRGGRSWSGNAVSRLRSSRCIPCRAGAA
jgi:hypothetical protein